jgi:hypothetical protein
MIAPVASLGSTSCIVNDDCMDLEPGVFVSFEGVAPADVATFTASPVCGAVPSPLCDPRRNDCALAESKGAAWSVVLPSTMEGACQVHVVLKDGQVFDKTSGVTKSSHCGFFGDEIRIATTVSLGDAGSHD